MSPLRVPLLDLPHELPELLPALPCPLAQVLGHRHVAPHQRLRVLQHVLAVLERLERHQRGPAPVHSGTWPNIFLLCKYFLDYDVRTSEHPGGPHQRNVSPDVEPQLEQVGDLVFEVVFALPVVARDPVEDQVVLLVLLEVVHLLLHVLKLHRHRLKVLIEILDAFLHVLYLLEERGLGVDGSVVDLGHVLHQVGVDLVRAVNEPSQSLTIMEKVKDYNQ